MKLGKIKTTNLLIVAFTFTLASCAYVDTGAFTKPTKTQTIKVEDDINIGIERYDEDAIEDYMSGLKGVVQFLNATQTADSSTIMQGQMLLGLALGQMKTSKIEIEDWPLGARTKVWDIKGKRIQSYNDLVNEERDRILADEQYNDKLKKLVKSIKLITKDTLLSN